MFDRPRCGCCQDPAEYVSKEDNLVKLCSTHKNIYGNKYKKRSFELINERFSTLLELKNVVSLTKARTINFIIKTTKKLIEIIKDKSLEQINTFNKIIKDVNERIQDFYMPQIIKEYLETLETYESNDIYFDEFSNEVTSFFKMKIPRFPEEEEISTNQGNTKFKGSSFVSFIKFKKLVENKIMAVLPEVKPPSRNQKEIPMIDFVHKTAKKKIKNKPKNINSSMDEIHLIEFKELKGGERFQRFQEKIIHHDHSTRKYQAPALDSSPLNRKFQINRK